MMCGKRYLEIAIQKFVWGVGDILTARYITEYLGIATVETNAIRKDAGFDGNFTYGMENISTNKRNLMNPDELLKMDNKKEIVMVRGKRPFICDKYVYMEHPNFNTLEDFTIEEQMEKFKMNTIKNEKQLKFEEIVYSFDDF